LKLSKSFFFGLFVIKLQIKAKEDARKVIALY